MFSSFAPYASLLHDARIDRSGDLKSNAGTAPNMYCTVVVLDSLRFLVIWGDITDLTTRTLKIETRTNDGLRTPK